MATKNENAKTTRGAKGKAGSKPSKNGKAKAARTRPAGPRKERAPRAKKEGLRDGQVRILHVLSKAKGAMPRAMLAEKAKITVGWACNFIGPTDVAKRKVTEERTGFPSLMTLGAVKAVHDDELNENQYLLTATGKKLLANTLKDRPNAMKPRADR